MVKSIVGTLTEGSKLKAANQSLRNFSKLATENTKYRLFFPKAPSGLEEESIVVAGAYGRQLDYEALGKAFVCYGEEEFTYDEETKITKDATVLPRLAAVARILHAAECRLELKQAEENAKKAAEGLGKELDTIALAETQRKIRVSYFGDDTVSPATLPDKKPVIGAAGTPLVTEVYAVPLGSDGTPEFSKAFYAAIQINNKKESQLKSILSNSEYNCAGGEYLEVGYDYMGSTKKDAGTNAAFYGTAESLRLCNKFPALWDANKMKLDMLSKTADLMINKSPMYAYGCDVASVVSAFNKYMSTKQLALLHIDFDSEDVKKNASYLLELPSIQDSPRISQQLREIVLTQEQRDDTDEDVVVNDKDLQASKAATLSEVAEAGGIVDGIDLSELQ